MRQRLLFSTLLVTSIAVLLLGLPLGVLTHQTVLRDNTNQLQREAEAIAAEVDNPAQPDDSAGAADDPQHLTQIYPGRDIEISPADGTAPLRAGDWDRHTAETSELGSYASAGTASGAEVRLWQDTEELRDRLASAWLGIGSLSLLAIGGAVGLAMLQARRLTLPLVDLAATAERLGSGVEPSQGRRYGIPEVDRVADVLDRSAERVAGLIASERHFATDASHQLRTPLTALSMRLEEIVAEANNADVVREEGQAALAQTERLAQTVQRLLGRSRQTQHTEVEQVPLDETLRELSDEWAPVLANEKRELRQTGELDLTVRTVRGDIAQVLGTLVENSVRHGAGTVTVHSVYAGHTVRVEVSDEGNGVPPELAPRIFDRAVTGGNGTGVGLALARHLAEAVGARIELIRNRPATFALFLPAGVSEWGRDSGPV